MVDFAKMLQQKRDGHQAPTPTPSQTRVTISIAGADYALRFNYDKNLVTALQAAVDRSERAWHKTEKVWLVSPEEIETAIKAMQPHTSQLIRLPEIKPSAPEVIEKTFQLDYLGATQDRGKRKSAMGSVNSDWSAEFPEDVLKRFFEGTGEQAPDGLQTLYQVLCIPESAPLELIKKAYKRLALQNHPDVNREEGAQELFIKINEAYKILIDPEQKKRYDAGLYFERQDRNPPYVSHRHHSDIYRSPLRCGLITARGNYQAYALCRL